MQTTMFIQRKINLQLKLNISTRFRNTAHPQVYKGLRLNVPNIYSKRKASKCNALEKFISSIRTGSILLQKHYIVDFSKLPRLADCI